MRIDLDASVDYPLALKLKQATEAKLRAACPDGTVELYPLVN